MYFTSFSAKRRKTVKKAKTYKNLKFLGGLPVDIYLDRARNCFGNCFDQKT